MRENTGRASKATASFDWVRLLMLFLMACSIALFLVVVKIVRSTEKEVQVTNPASLSRPAEEPRSQAGVTRAHSRNKGNRRNVVRTAPKTSTIHIKDDSTPVFQSNSADSTLVKSLKKGDQVRSGGIEIIDSTGSWTLIQNSGRSGFVPSEMLERESPAKQAKQ
jgi:hypothetical protein